MSLCIPGTRTTDPLDRKQTVDPLDQWVCFGVKLQGLHRAYPPPPPSNLTGALTGHSVVRRRRTCKEWNGTREGILCVIKLALHIVGAKPSEPIEGWESQWSTHVGVTNVMRQCLQEKPCSIVSFCIPRMQTADLLDGKPTVDPLDQWDWVLEWNCRASSS